MLPEIKLLRGLSVDNRSGLRTPATGIGGVRASLYGSSVPNAGCGDAPGLVCPIAASEAQTKTKSVKVIRRLTTASRNHDCVVGLELDVLRRVATLHHVLVVEWETELLAIGSVAKHIDVFLFGKITKATGECDGVNNRQWFGQREGSRFHHHPEHIELLALDLLHDHRNFRLGDEVLQLGLDLGFQLLGRFAAGLEFTD